MTTLSIDVETFSSEDLKSAGVYRYAQSPGFEILLFGYSVDDGPANVIDLTVDFIPDEIIAALTDPDVIKTAYNAAFERACISAYLKIYLPPEQWECTMVKCAMLGLPFGLGVVCAVLNLGQEKLFQGKQLIKYFCSPCKPTKINGGRQRNRSYDALEKWETFISYCKQDVELERLIADKIKFFNPTPTEKRLWALDQKINDTGVLLDIGLIKRAIEIANNNAIVLETEARNLTGIDNPNSGAQLKKWLSAEMDQEVTGLTKKDIPVLIAANDCKKVNRVLEIRQELAKTSNKKWPAMLECIGVEGRVRGLLQFHGAGRTGRWAGRLIQPQNLPQSKLDDRELDIARNLVLQGDSEGIDLMFDNIPDTLSQLIRTAIIPTPGHRFIVCDLASIEARIIAWLSGEKWRMDVFNTHGKIYEASAAAMFKVPIETVTKGSVLRQKGKIAELALGYQGGVNALKTMGALEMGIDENDLQGLVYAWRNANRNIVQYWYDINEAALNAVREGSKVTTDKGITFHVEKGILFIGLPSGRKISYLRPKLSPGQFGSDQVSYEGTIQATKQWGQIDAYGGKFVENIVQALARDVLADCMLRLDTAGYSIVLSVHDEVVCEMQDRVGSLDEVVKIMSAPISWAKGLPLAADGFESNYYKK